LRQRPDFAIITPTFHDRMEIPASAAPSNRTGIGLQTHLQNNTIQNGYDPTAGIDNVNYGNNPYRMICETIFSLAENLPHPYRSTRIDKNTQNAVKQYVNFLYDSNWKQQIDKWIITEGILQLVHAEIKFLFIPYNLWMPHEEMQVPVDPKYILKDRSLSQPAITHKNPFVGEDPGYHGSELSQEIIADHYYNLITNTWHL
jgi:hypothetical protein